MSQFVPQHRLAPYHDLNDEELFVLYSKGDVMAFDLYYERTSPKIWGFLKCKLNSVSQAEEIFQEVWSKIHRSKEQYNPKFPINPWVFTIARSVLFDGMRSLKRNQEDLVEQEKLEAFIQPEQTQDQTITSVTLDSLSAEQKKLIDLRYLKEWSFSEIAISLGLSEDNVRQKISRTIRKLRKGFTT